MHILEEYCKNRKLSGIGAAIATGASADQLKIPLDQALFILSYGKLGKVGYTTMRLSFLPYGVILPTYDEITKHKSQNIIPSKLVWKFYSSV